MKIALFDLGNTLEYTKGGTSILMPGAHDLLSEIQQFRDSNGQNPSLGLVSDWNRQSAEYYNLLQNLGIDSFFKPFSEKVTLSNEVNATKPDERIFRTAIDKIQQDLPYKNVIFITEDKNHIAAVRRYGMMAIRINLPGETDGEADSLTEMLPLVNLFLLA
jgi:FMN phosphatase YigB (HAD superfamily)